MSEKAAFNSFTASETKAGGTDSDQASRKFL
jgi:hypothetical protein